MNVEIIEFYPLYRDAHQYTGTIRLRLIDIGIDLLGVHVKRTKDRWFFNIPFKTGTDDKNNLVQYPLISFIDKEKQRELINCIREKAPSFIEERIRDVLKPVVFKQKPSKKSLPKKEEIKDKGHHEPKYTTQSKVLKWTKSDGLKKR